jgi:uncharacterized membrane protein
MASFPQVSPPITCAPPSPPPYVTNATLDILRGVKFRLSSVAKHGLRVFENMVVTTIFGSQRKVGSDWRTLHGEELHGLH